MKISIQTKVVLGTWALRLLRSTNRWNVEGDQHYRDLLAKNQSVIIAAWHGHLLPPFIYLAGNDYYSLAGTHSDAELISQVGNRIGWQLLRGSSTEKGTEAFKGIVKTLRKPGTLVAMTPDGPRGPAKIPKPGAIRSAQITGAAIVPVAGHSRRHWSFTNWDTFFIPKPFGTIELIFGRPLYFSRNDNPDNCANQLIQALYKLEKLVDTRVQG